MDIEFGGIYDKKTYFRAIAWIYKPSRRAMILRIAAFVVFSALYAAAVITAFQDEGPSSIETARMARHLITFVVLGYILFQPSISSYRTASRLWKDPVTRRNITGRVSNLGVIIEPRKDPLTWDTFVKMNKTPDMVVLLTASRLFVLLPRAFFKDARDWETVQKIVDA